MGGMDGLIDDGQEGKTTKYIVLLAIRYTTTYYIAFLIWFWLEMIDVGLVRSVIRGCCVATAKTPPLTFYPVTDYVYTKQMAWKKIQAGVA
jgi:hypothetical protein